MADSPGLLALALWLFLDMLTWAMAIPRALAGLLVTTLDALEGAALGMVWESQRGSIAGTLRTHRHLEHAAVDARVRPRLESRAVQTGGTEAGAHEWEQALGALVPDMLRLLRAMPLKTDLELAAREQASLVRSLCEKNQELLAALQHSCVAASQASAGAQLAIADLASRLDRIDEGLGRALGAFGAGSLVPECSSSNQRDASQEEEAGAALACAEPPIAQDEHVQTPQDASNARRASAALSGVALLVPALPAASSGCVSSASSYEHNTTQGGVASERICALDALRELGHQEPPLWDAQHGEPYSHAASTKSHRFSIRREAMRRSWFGKKPA